MTTSRRSFRTLFLVAALGAVAYDPERSLAAVQTAGRTPSVASPTPGELLRVNFDDLGRARSAGTGPVTLANEGSEPLAFRVSAAGGGMLRSVPGKAGGYAARFPAFAAGYTQRAVVTATSSSDDDPLSPGDSDFTFGSDFTLDKVSEGGTADNGNNVVQRGLFVDPSQYKIQIDHGRASCRVAGSAGAAVVRSTQVITADAWYRISCSRTTRTLTLALGRVDGAITRTSVSARTGVVDSANSTPLSLGGKVTGTGKVVTGNSDQFNGALDNVFLRLD
jgi:hypothetical protein